MARTRETIAGETGAAPPPKRNLRARRRIQVYMNDDGSPDWDAVPEQDRQRLGFDGGGLKPPEPPATVEPVAPELVGLLFGVVTQIEAGVIAPRFGVPGDAAVAALTPPPQMGEAINTAAARVLNKYQGSWGRYQDELVLGCLLIAWQASAIGNLRKLAAELKEAEAKPAASPAPAVVRPAADAFTEPVLAEA